MIPDPDLIADASDRALARRAVEARARANPTVSGFHVGACVRSAAGDLYSSGNVESPTNIFNLCAERSAIVVAFAAEGPAMRIAAIATCGDAPSVSPCGACRQLIVEFGGAATVVYVDKGQWISRLIRDLLPSAYDGWSAG